MKRGAERQLTKDGPDEDDEIEEIQEPQGFQKADESVLVTRQMRALPKRALAGSKVPSLNGLTSASAPEVGKVPAAPPKFGGFTGFGSASNSFTFTTPQPTSTPAPSSHDSAFKPAQSTATLKAAVMPSFPRAIKLNPPDSEPPLPKPVTPPSTQEDDDTAFKYFKSLRGLNVSFISFISKEVDKDPFFDVASLVESYRNLRTTIQSEFDSSSRSSTTTGPPPTRSTSLFDQRGTSEKPAPAFSMPKPPTSFSFGGTVITSSTVPPTSESGKKTGGFSFPAFTPPPGSNPQLPFSLAPKPSESTTTSSSTTPLEPPKSTSTFGISTSTSTSNAPTTSGFSFSVASNTTALTSKSIGASSQGSESPSSTPPAPASTTSTFGGNNVPNFFATSKTTGVFGTSDASKPISAFGPSIFGSSNIAESSKQSSGFDGSKSTLFGSTTTTTSASVFGSSEKPTSVFGAASSLAPKPSAFGFGKPAGSIGNPVGFGFGSSSSKSGDGTTTPGSTSGFTFGAPAMKSSDSLFTPPTTDKSSESTPQPETEGGEEGGEEAGAKLLPQANHDEEGEGEEDEETTHVVRCKVFRLSKSDDKSDWKDLGVGNLRLKKHNETSARRMLLRNSSTGRIIINFRLYASLKPSLAKNVVSFIGYDSSILASFKIRVKTEEQAVELKQAIEREVAAAQATE